MTKDARPPPPLSLVHLFEPPDGFRGCFGWLCGYAADAAFLERAAERFTQESRAQRAYVGRVALAAMIDPGNPQIAPIDAPGVLHLPWRVEAEREFRLLHAKVAILGYTHESDGSRWLLRLIVGTGNWTRQTLEESLDLAWQLDLDGDRLKTPDDDVQQACVDIRAAWSLLDTLRSKFDTRVLYASPGGRPSETIGAMKRVESWIEQVCSRPYRNRIRFFDNRSSSLLKQLAGLASNSSGATARNYLALGSGFYESVSGAAAGVMPSVIDNIVRVLQGKSGGPQLLTAAPEVDVFVNELACQAVATALPAFRDRGWNLRPAHVPKFMGPGLRSLHAKFIFSASWRTGSDRCASGWLYLGSGNLTGPGFVQPARRDTGNLEAGVVIDAREQTWSDISNVLPLQWEKSLNDTPETVRAGGDEEERVPVFFAAPVAWFEYVRFEGAGWLRTPDAPRDPFEVLAPDKESCPFVEERGFAWSGAIPRQVRIRWNDDGTPRESDVPVVDAYGRIAGTAQEKLDLDSAWSQLVNFPLPPPEEELSEYQVEGEGSVAPESRRAGAGTAGSAYPIRAVMQLVENIASLQTSLPAVDWQTWCVRLGQTLERAAGSEAVTRSRDLGLNLLSPLRQRPFRPEYAADRTKSEGVTYEAVLASVEVAWSMNGLRRIGEP